VGGKSKPQTIGYWYRPLIHFGLCQGPIDSFVEFRGGERTAWKGEQPESGQIYIDALDLWGGESSEGGIAGYCDVMMGEADQAPSAYLARHLGSRQPGYRGVASLVFKGGRYGAMNPYPKPASFKLRRILKGWDEDACWYPETAAVPVAGYSPPVVNGRELFDDLSKYTAEEGSLSAFTFTGGTMIAGPGAPRDKILRDIAPRGWFRSLTAEFEIQAIADDALSISLVSATNFYLVSFNVRRGLDGAKRAGLGYGAGTVATDFFGTEALSIGRRYRFHAVADEVGSPLVATLSDLDAGVDVGTMTLPDDGGLVSKLAFWRDDDAVVKVTRLEWSVYRTDDFAMNPAHMVYDSLTSTSMQGEPAATINDASFRAAADRLYSEGFGLCTAYDPDQETVEQFRQRLCNVIGAQCSRSRVDGLWYLDLIRNDYVLADLPILGDDDLLDFKEETSTLDDAVNQVTVAWFDPERKEGRTTAPLQALGAVMGAGAVNAETVEYPEIPVEPLAVRVGARDLQNKATPLRRLTLTCTRTPYAWRKGQRFRLQAPKRGIADMVCFVGDINTGSLRSGAVRLVAVQDAFSMPATAYVVGEPPGSTDESTPQGSPQQRLFEVPYVELAATLSHADLAALPPAVGYVGAMATAPRVGTNFALYTRAVGESFGEGSQGNWCPAATFEEAASFLDSVFTVAAQSNLGLVEVGTRALWEHEEVRVDAIDPEAGTITLARGCADTVPAEHAAGTVCYFHDLWHAGDGREYADGETVEAKLLTRTASQVQDPTHAPLLSLEIGARPHRPYPPGQFRLAGLVNPGFVEAPVTATWVHRDRLQQADQLIESELPGIGPEAGSTYTARWYLDDVLVHTDTGVSGTSVSYTPPSDGWLRIELASVRDGLESWQAHSRRSYFTSAAAEPWQAETGELITTESDEPIYPE